MDYKKNIAFTSLIKINGRLREFNFRKRGSSYYDGDTSDERGNRLFFKMEKWEGSWKIDHTGLPAWLMENEPLVIGVIQKEEQQIFPSYCISSRSFLRKYFWAIIKTVF